MLKVLKFTDVFKIEIAIHIFQCFQNNLPSQLFKFFIKTGKLYCRLTRSSNPVFLKVGDTALLGAKKPKGAIVHS